MQTVTLTTCDNAAEAHLLQGALANAGIGSVLTNEYTASTLPNLCGMMGMGVTVVVLAKDYDRARQLLNTLSPASGQPCCPYCGSTDIGTSLGRRRGLKAFFAFLSLLAWTPLGNIKTSYRCRRCGEDFSKPAPSPGQTPGDRITSTPPDTNPEAEQCIGSTTEIATETDTATESPAGSATETGLYH